MPRQKYIFDSKNIQQKAISFSLKNNKRRIAAIIVASIILSLIYAKIYTTYFDTPKEIFMKQKISELQLKYNLLKDNIKNSEAIINDIGQRDNNVYRAVFGLNESTTAEITKNYVSEYENAPAVAELYTMLDKLKNKVYREQKSFEELSSYAINMDKMATCVPAIHPIDMKFVTSMGGYGWRTDPVYGGKRHHDGMDFAGPIGTPVYSTGDGVISNTNFSFTGYGNVIDIDHGFGYMTRYAHLSKILVRKGQKVKRGDKIALLGNVGKSTGPHLHYEVRYKGEPMNPSKYFPADMTDINYSEIIEKQASNKEQ